MKSSNIFKVTALAAAMTFSFGAQAQTATSCGAANGVATNGGTAFPSCFDDTYFTTTGEIWQNGVQPDADTHPVITIKGGVFATQGAFDALATTVAGLQNSAGTGNAVQYDDSTKGTVTLGGAGGTKITNVTAGAVNANSTDAVNGSQLNTVVNQVTNLDNRLTTVEGSIVNIDNRLTNVEGDVTALVEQGRFFKTNGTATDPSANATGTLAVAMGSGATASAANSVALGSNSVADSVGTQVSTGAIAGTTYNYAGTTTGTVSVGSKGAERQITNVSAGEVSFTSTDAINGSQMYAAHMAINTVANDVKLLGDSAVKYDDPAVKDKVTLGGITSTDGGVTGGTIITNVHQGAVNATSTDAVNGAQLYEVKSGAVNYSTNVDGSINYNDVYLGNPNGTGGNTAIHNVADGAVAAGSKDAVNGGQLYDVAQQGRDTRKEARAGVAAAMSIPMPHTAPGKAAVAVGVGHWKGETAFGAAVGYTTPNNKWKFTSGASWTKQGTGVNASVSYAFGGSSEVPAAQTGYDSSTYGAAYSQINSGGNAAPAAVDRVNDPAPQSQLSPQASTSLNNYTNIN